MLLLMDNVFRFVQAGAEMSSVPGRLPSRVGYRPTLATEVAGLQERIASVAGSGVTAIQAAYVPADDFTDPAVTTISSHMDCVIVLSRAQAAEGFYPANDPLGSSFMLLDPLVVGDVRGRAQERDGSKARTRPRQGGRRMRLSIVTPLDIVMDEDNVNLRAEDASGSFGIPLGHALFLTSLAISIPSWRTGTVEGFCAVRGGVLTMTGGTIAIATREAVAGDDLATLDTEVLAQFHADEDAERVEHVETLRPQMNVIRRMVSRLSTSADTGNFQ